MKPSVAAVLGALLSLGLAMLYIHYLPAPPVVGVTVEATKAPELRKETTVPVQVVEPLQVYQPAVKKKLKLPAAVQQDAGKHVVASIRTPNDERAHTVTTVVDSKTGEFASYDRAEPLPWVQPNTTTHIGAYWGVKNGEQVTRLQVQQELVRLKALHVEAIASTDIGGNTDSFVGIGGRWSF